jgi:DNA-binding CsgD family transcriptional regulator
MRVYANFTDELIEMIYAAMLGEASWQAFINRLNDVFPDAFSTLFFHNMNRNTGGITLISSGADSVLPDYSEYYSKINPWMQRVATTPIGVGVIGEQIVERQDFNKSEYYNDFLNRNGMETGVGVTLFRDEGCYFLLSILTGDKETDRNLERAQLLGRLAPHLQRAFRYYRSDQFQTPALSFGEAVGSAVDVATIVVDDRLRVRNASAAAQKHLSDGDLVGLDPLGRLRFNNPTQHGLLCGMLDYGPQASRTAKFFAGAYEISLVRIGQNSNIEFFTGPSVAILIRRMNSTALTTAEEAMTEAYSLTPAERRVLAGILTGHRIKDIAASHEIGLETVRSQLKSIYLKTSVNSQAGLVRLASGLAEPSTGA